MTTAEPSLMLLLALASVAVWVLLVVLKSTRTVALSLAAAAALAMLVLGSYFYLARRSAIYRNRQQAARQAPVRPRNLKFNITLERRPTVASPPQSVAPPLQPSGAEIGTDEAFGDLGTLDAAGPPRPEWVESEPNYEGDAHKIAVVAGPFKTKDECRRALNEEIKTALTEYFDWYMSLDSSVPNGSIRPTDQDVQLLKTETWPEPHQHPRFGTMYRLHALLTIDQKYRDHLQQRAHQALVGERLKKTGFASAGVLALLTTLFGFLKLKQSARARSGGVGYAQVGI